MRALLSKLKRRSVFRVGAAYAVVSWLIIQVIDIVFPRLGIPDSAITLILILLLVGFPIALVLAWIFQWSPEGVTRTEEDGSASPAAGQKLNVITAAALVAALGIIAYQNFVRGVDSVPTFATSDKSVAVLPFDDLSESRDQGWFADGVAEESCFHWHGCPNSE